MSCRMSAILLKHFSNKSYKQSIYFLHSNLYSYTTAVNATQKQNLKGVIQVSNNLKPLINLSVNEILSYADYKQISGTESVTFLKALRMQTMFNKVPSQDFKTDHRFKQLCNIFNQNCRFLDFNLLISGLRSLLEIGMPVDSLPVITAEMLVLKNVQEMSCFQLIQCLHFHHRFRKSDLQNQVVEALLEDLSEKLDDISTPSEILLLSQICYLFNEENQNVIAQKTVEFITLLSVHEMCKVVCSLAQKSNRSIPVLSSIAFHLRMTKEVLDVKETIDLLYSLKKLNFYDVKLFLHLLYNVVYEIPKIKQSSLISGLLTVCGQLKLKHTGLLDACTEWIQTHIEICRNREFISFILTAATLYHLTSRSSNLINSILPNLTVRSEVPPNVLLDIAWSLAILNCIPKSLLLYVLCEEFYIPLLGDPDIQKRHINALKIMNLKGVMKMHHPENIFRYSLYLDPIKLKESDDIENNRKHVINVLSNLVPKEKYLSSWQSNDLGIFIDAEFIMDKNIKPLSLSEYGVMTRPRKHIKSLPNGAKRIALQVMFHKDFTQGIVNYAGINALSARLLSHCGYSVVRISFDEFMKNKTEVKKSKYLMQMIKAIFLTTEKSEM